MADKAQSVKTFNSDLYKPYAVKPEFDNKTGLATKGKKSFFYHNPILNPMPSYTGNPLIRKELYGI